MQVGNVHHRTIKNLPDGTFSLLELKALVRGDDPHWPITSLVCIENTQNMMGGKALPLRWLDEVRTRRTSRTQPLKWLDEVRIRGTSRTQPLGWLDEITGGTLRTQHSGGSMR